MATYTTVDNISNELNGLTINSTTVPSSTVVEGWIDEAEALIELKTGKVWGSSTASSAVFDYDGRGHIILPYKPIISVTKVEYETQGLGASSTTWSTITEGRGNTNNFIVYKPEGRIEFRGSAPTAGSQNLRVTLDYGYTSVPSTITTLTTKMVANRVTGAVVQAQAQEGGGSVSVGNISITDPTTFGLDAVQQRNKEISELFGLVQGIKSVGYVPKA